MEDCNINATDDQMWCILSYNNNMQDVLINYTMLFIQICVNGKVYQRTNTTTSNNIVAFLFVWLFQIGLCFAVHCSGISIVWNAMAGWVLFICVADRENLSFLVLLIPCFAVDVYYGFMSEAITTVAHFCAVIMGLCLHSYFNQHIAVENGDKVKSPLLAPPEGHA